VQLQRVASGERTTQHSYLQVTLQAGVDYELVLATGVTQSLGMPPLTRFPACVEFFVDVRCAVMSDVVRAADVSRRSGPAPLRRARALTHGACRRCCRPTRSSHPTLRHVAIARCWLTRSADDVQLRFAGDVLWPGTAGYDSVVFAPGTAALTLWGSDRWPRSRSR
jgi:hypothetical protein